MPREAMGTPDEMDAFRTQQTAVQQSTQDAQKDSKNGLSVGSGRQLQRMRQSSTHENEDMKKARDNELKTKRREAVQWVENLTKQNRRPEIESELRSENTNLNKKEKEIDFLPIDKLSKFKNLQQNQHHRAKLDVKWQSINQIFTIWEQKVDDTINKGRQIAQQKEQFELAGTETPPLTNHDVDLLEGNYDTWAHGESCVSNRDRHCRDHHHEFGGDIKDFEGYHDKVAGMLNRSQDRGGNLERYIQSNGRLAVYDPLTGYLAVGGKNPRSDNPPFEINTGYWSGPGKMIGSNNRRLYVSDELITTTRRLTELETRKEQEEKEQEKLRKQIKAEEENEQRQARIIKEQQIAKAEAKSREVQAEIDYSRAKAVAQAEVTSKITKAEEQFAKDLAEAERKKAEELASIKANSQLAQVQANDNSLSNEVPHSIQVAGTSSKSQSRRRRKRPPQRAGSVPSGHNRTWLEWLTSMTKMLYERFCRRRRS
jgi:hypothetical protein